MSRRDRPHREAMAELFRDDPAYAAELLAEVRRDGDPAELAATLRQMAEAFGRAGPWWDSLTDDERALCAVQVKFRRYDVVNYLKTEDDIAAYLDAVAEDGDPALIAAALGDVARARNLSQLARDVEGDPSLATVMKVAQALGLRLDFKPTRR
ncbi:addiction module antidote protein [Escherichia coli]|uniref:addiction module antidote protein n=1 Tax=Salmonella enterica TaxID=28901 RepID=UPI0020CEB1FD|nr:addiction module antidote protein [Salmonella enterica]